MDWLVAKASRTGRPPSDPEAEGMASLLAKSRQLEREDQT